MGGVVGTDPGDDPGPVTDSPEHRCQYSAFLVIGGGRRLPGGARDHQAVTPGVDEVGGQPGGGPNIDTAVLNGVTIAVRTVPSWALASNPLVLTGS